MRASGDAARTVSHMNRTVENNQKDRKVSGLVLTLPSLDGDDTLIDRVVDAFADRHRQDGEGPLPKVREIAV